MEQWCELARLMTTEIISKLLMASELSLGMLMLKKYWYAQELAFPKAILLALLVRLDERPAPIFTMKLKWAAAKLTQAISSEVSEHFGGDQK
jgi:hypothetical protein